MKVNNFKDAKVAIKHIREQLVNLEKAVDEDYNKQIEKIKSLKGSFAHEQDDKKAV